MPTFLVSISSKMVLADCFPSSTPHWSKLKIFQIMPCTNILCSYSAISEPKDSGVSFSIKSVFVGLFPAKILKGAKNSVFSGEIPNLFKSATTCVTVFPINTDSVCAN